MRETRGEQEVKSAIICIVKHRYEKHEEDHKKRKFSERVPLKDIKFCLKDFENYIPKMTGEVHVRHMLEVLCRKGELERHEYSPRLYYALRKQGNLYKDLERN
jgi:hypothetical protein